MIWREIRWENIDFAWGFLGVACLFFAFIALGWWKRRVRARIIDPNLADAMMQNVSVARQRWKAAMILAGCALLVLVVMRPKHGLKETTVSNTGIDIAVVLDVSKSMSVQDVVPSRLEASKLEISALLQELHGGRISLVPFAGIPFIQTALTDDFDVIRMYLTDLQTADMPVPGTNLGRAMQLGLLTLTGKSENPTDSLDMPVDHYAGSKHKAMIIFTDGEDHESTPVKIAKQAKEEGIRIFVIGVGTATGNPNPNVQEDGTTSGYLRDDDGKPVISGLNESLLKEIAQESGGAYFRYNDESIVEPLYAQIDQIEKKEYEEREMKLLDDRFQLLLLPAIILLILEMLIGDRRRRRKSRAVPVAILCMFGAFLPEYDAHAQEPKSDALPWYMTTNGDVDDGNEALSTGEGHEAIASYQKAGETLPWETALYFNLGLAHLAIDDFEAAVDYFSRSRNTAKPEMHARIAYNIGLAYARWGESLESATTPEVAPNDEEVTPKVKAKKKWNDAIASFERTLTLLPGDENAAWNLEIALVAMCRLENDDAEPNNSYTQATPIELAENPQTDRFEGARELVLCMGDRDWFSLELGPGDRLRVDMKVEEKDQVGGEGGATIILSDENNAAELARTDLKGPNPLVLEHTITAQEKKTYLLEVRGIDENAYDVSLDIAVRPPCSSKEDELEDNDLPITASELPGGIGENLRMCPDDPDWFRVTLHPEESLFAFASTQSEEEAPFDLKIYNEDQKPIANSGVHQESRIATVLDPGPGTYFVKVESGPETESNYQVVLQVLPPCPLGNDSLEPNNTPEEASSLSELTQNTPQQNRPAPVPTPPPGPAQPDFPPGVTAPPGGASAEQPQTALLRICPGDEDYIEVTIPADTDQIATILFDHQKGDLSLSVLDSINHEPIAESNKSTAEINGESFAFPKEEEEKTYLLKIRGKLWDQNFYILRIDSPPPNQDQSQDQENNDENEENEENEEEQQDNQDENEDEKEEEEQEEEKKEEEETPKEKDIEQIEDVLRRLDRNRENLEAQDAKRQFKLPKPLKDW